LLSQLGKTVENGRTAAFKTAKGQSGMSLHQSAREALDTHGAQSNGGSGTGNGGGDFVLDGVDHWLQWRDGQVEIAFITPTGRALVGAPTSQLWHQSSLAFSAACKASVFEQQKLVHGKSSGFYCL